METQRDEDSVSERRRRMLEVSGGGHNPPPSLLPELRLVLLGRKGAGKSSAGNTILGLTGGFENSRPTEECVKRRADVAGRRVTVVDTPGWEWYYPVNGTPGWVRRETKRSVSLCPPGPHAVLLVVRSCTSVTADYHQQMEEHLELLGKAVWDHTLVLFTRGDELGSVPIEERIRKGGKAFQKLLERCGNRFHVLENKRRVDDGSQVRELMKKMERLVEDRGGRYYQTDLMLLEMEVDSKRRARDRRKKQRLMEAQTHRGTIRAALMNDAPQAEDLDERNLFSRGSRRLPELRLVLLGERETGKSSVGNAILGGPGYFQSGEATEECLRRQTEVSNRMVTVVDVPGWEGGPEGITPERVKREIVMSVTQCPPGPHGFLLTLRVDALVQAQSVREHLELLGEMVWRHTLLLFTRGDQLREGVTIQQHIQGGGKDLHWLVDRCSNRFHVISSNLCLESRNPKAQITELLEKVEKMVAGNRCEAFSPLVHEIQELGRQKNDKFQLKVKEFGEKSQRQEEELKKMKEREVKSIRWFFERRKKDKVQSPGKAEREEAPYRGEDDRRSVMGELEDRMAWLTEDKEREIHELSAEMSKVTMTLHQEMRAKEQLLMRLEEREREGEELKEKVDELQMKLLEIERLGAVKEHEQKKEEAEILKSHLDEMNELKNKLVDAEKENVRMSGKVEESQRRYEEEAMLQRQETERNLKEKDNERENILREIKEVKLQAEGREREQSQRFEEIVEKKEKLREVIEMMTKEMEQLRMSYQEQVRATEDEREMHRDVVEKYNTLIDKLVGKDKEIEQTVRDKEKELHRNAKTQEKLRQKDDEIVKLRERDQEKDREMETLKDSVNEKQREIEKLKETVQTSIGKHSEDLDVLTIKLDEIEKLKESDLQKAKDIDRLTLNISEKQNHIEKLKNTIQVTIEEQESITKQLHEELRIKHEENEKLKQKDQEKERDMDKLRQDICKKQREAEKLRDCVEESAAKLENLEEELNEKVEEITKLRRSDLEKDSEIHSLVCQKQDAERFKDSVRSNIEESAAQLKHLEEELKVNDEELKIKDEETIQLRTRVQEKDREINRLWENINAKQNNIDKFEEQTEKIKAQLQTRENEMLEKDKEMDTMLRTIHDKYRQDIDQLKSSFQAHSEQGAAQIKHLEKEFEIKMEAYNAMEMQVESVKKQLEETRLLMQMKENIIDQLQQQLADAQRHLEDLKQHHMEVQEQNNTLQNTSADLEKEFEKIRCKNEAYERDLQSLVERYQIQTKEIKGLEQDTDKLKQLLKEKEGEMQDMKVNYEKNQEEHGIIREQELQRRERDVEKKRDEINRQEQEHQRRKMDVEKKSNEIKRQEQELQRREREAENKMDEIKRQEQELTDEKQELEMQKYRIKEEERNLENEGLNNKRWAVDLMTMREEFEKREEELVEREEKLKSQEEQMTCKKDELQAMEKILDTKEKQMKDLTEKQEKNMENLRQQLERKEQELQEMHEEVIEDKQTLEILRENLETRERELNKREQTWELKVRESSEELQNNKLDLLQQLDGLQNKEQELLKMEQDLQLKRQKFMEQQRAMENLTASYEQHHLDITKWKQALSQREQKLKSEEIHLQKRKQVMQNMEERHKDMLLDLKKRSLDTGETERNDKHKLLHNQESDEVEDKTQSLELLKTTLDGKEKELDERTLELNHRQDQLNRKQEELEKWEKYLYNAELQLIHKEPLSGYRRWTNSGKLNEERLEVDTIDDANNKNNQKFSQRPKGISVDSDGESEEDFFELSTPSLQPTHHAPWSMSELRLMLLGDSWSSRHPARCNIVGPGAEGSNPWRGEISSRRVMIIEPQGLKWRSAIDSEEHPSQNLSLCQPGPHAFILAIPAYVSVTRLYRRAVERTMSALGDKSWKHAIVLLTWAEMLGESGQQHVKRNGDLEWLVRRCGNRCHVLDSRHLQSHTMELLEKVEEMLGKNHGQYYKLD